MTNNYGPIRGCQNQYSTNISLLCLVRSKVRKAFPRRVSILFYLSEPIGKKTSNLVSYGSLTCYHAKLVVLHWFPTLSTGTSMRTLCHTGPYHVTMLNLWFCSGSLLCLPVPV